MILDTGAATTHPSLSAAALRLHEGRWKRKPQDLSGASAAISANENKRIKGRRPGCIESSRYARAMCEWYDMHIA